MGVVSSAVEGETPLGGQEGVIWSAAACRRFSAGSSLPAAAASRGRESGAKAPHSKLSLDPDLHAFEAIG